MATSSSPSHHAGGHSRSGSARAKAEHHDGRALARASAHPQQGLRPDQRRVAENHENVVGVRGDRGPCRQHRMGGPAALRLHEDLGARQHPLGFGRDRIAAPGPTTTAVALPPASRHGVEHMRQQRSAGDRVQHLRPRRTHAGALAGREHDGKAGAFSYQAAILARWRIRSPQPARPHIRVRGAGKGGMRELALGSIGPIPARGFNVERLSASRRRTAGNSLGPTALD